MASSSNWASFYEHYLGAELGRPNAEGWLNVDCVMPWHDDSDKHAAINVLSGNYRCMHDDCKGKIRDKAGRECEAISPAEFLQFTQGLSDWDSHRLVSETAASFADDEKPEKLEKTFKVLPQREEKRLHEAQAILNPSIPLVADYCSSRGIRFETLRQAGCGYLRSYGGHEYLALPYMAGGQLVAVRLRSWHGARKRFIPGSCQSLFMGDSLLDSESRTAIICEGETDALVLHQLLSEGGFEGTPVVGTPGVDFRHEWRRHFQDFNRVICVPQSDRASQQTFLHNLRTVFGARLEVVLLPWPANIYGGNDISDFLRACPEKQELLVQLLGLSEDDTKRKHYALSLDDMRVESQTESKWIVPNLIERGTKTLIVGEPKSYKTWIAVNMMYAVCAAQPFMGNPVWTPTARMSALLVEEEGPTYRISQRFARVFGAESTNGLWVVHRQGVKVDDTESFAKLRQTILQLHPDLIILDPYASIHRQDENAVQGAIIVQDALNEILRALPSAAIVVLHHTPKGGDGPRGSGALWGAGDVMLRVSKIDAGRVFVRIDERDLPDETEGGMEFTLDDGTGRFSPVLDINIVRPKKVVDSADTALVIFKYITSREGEEWIPTVDIQSACELSANTARKALNELVRAEVLDQRGTGRKGDPKEYSLTGKPLEVLTRGKDLVILDD